MTRDFRGFLKVWQLTHGLRYKMLPVSRRGWQICFELPRQHSSFPKSKKLKKKNLSNLADCVADSLLLEVLRKLRFVSFLFDPFTFGSSHASGRTLRIYCKTKEVAWSEIVMARRQHWQLRIAINDGVLQFRVHTLTRALISVETVLQWHQLHIAMTTTTRKALVTRFGSTWSCLV